MLPPFSDYRWKQQPSLVHNLTASITILLSPLILPAYIYAPSPSVIHFTLMMEAAQPPETLVSIHIITRCHNPKDHYLNPHCHEILTSLTRYTSAGPNHISE